MVQEKKERINPRVIGAILATGLMSLSGVIIETALNVTFPTLMQRFHINTGTVQWMTTLYLTIVACIVPVSSYLKRRFLMIQLFVTANLLFILGILIDGLSPNFAILLIGRIIQAFGTGIALPLMFNIILEQVPSSRIGLMTGIGTLVTAIGPAVGPTYGGILVTRLSWRYIFWILLPFLIISFFVGIKTIQQVKPTVSEHLDWPSMLGIVVTFGGLIYGLSSISNHSWLSFSVIGSIIVGVFGANYFCYRSFHIKRPMIQLQALKNRKFNGHLLAFFLIQITSLGLSFILPNYLQLVDHQTAFVAGLIVFPGALVGAAFAPVGGQILDHFGAKKPILFGLGLSTVSLLIMTLLARRMNVLVTLVIFVCYMVGIGFSFGNMMTNGLKQLTGDLKADGNALMNALQQFAAAVGTALVSAIISESQSSLRATMAEKTAVGSQIALLVLFLIGGLSVITMIFTLLLKRNNLRKNVI